MRINKCLSYCVLIIIICSCNDLSDHLGVSNSITDSKKKGVFIAEYKSLANPIKINDSLKIGVEKIWLEKKWRYDDDLNAKIIEGYQMILESEKDDLKGFTIDWTIGISADKYWRFCNANTIISDFDAIPKDTIAWKVQKGDHLDSLSVKKIIGDFLLVKK
ncbi:MAG: hypothetical protein ABJA78_11840 [Ferruginibacter sp.]